MDERDRLGVPRPTMSSLAARPVPDRLLNAACHGTHPLNIEAVTGSADIRHQQQAPGNSSLTIVRRFVERSIRTHSHTHRYLMQEVACCDLH